MNVLTGLVRISCHSVLLPIRPKGYRLANYDTVDPERAGIHVVWKERHK
jgi:hypothetical protein